MHGVVSICSGHSDCAGNCSGDIVPDTVCCVGQIPDVYASPDYAGTP